MRCPDLARLVRRGALLAGVALLGACQAIPSAAPPPPSAPPPPPPPPVAAVPAPPPAPEESWDVATPTPGEWRYQREAGGSAAHFAANATAAPLLTIRCASAGRQIALLLPGPGAAGTVTLRTTAGVLAWPATAEAAGLQATRAAGDSGFDWIAFSRGRFAIEAPGRARLVVPVWAELARVVEDCRG